MRLEINLLRLTIPLGLGVSCCGDPGIAQSGGSPDGTPLPYRMEGLNFSPYLPGQDPSRNPFISEEQIRERMSVVASHTRSIRTFGTRDGLDVVGRIAQEFGLTAVIGAWISSDDTANAEQIDRLVAVANAGEADMVVVGSEVVLRGDLPVAQLIDLIAQVRSRLPAGVPVAYADVYSVFLQNPDLVSAVDVVFSNHYPYWEAVDISQAMRELSFQYLQLVALANGREVVISETGWPSDGNAVGTAVPTPETAAAYLLEFVSWARENSVTYYYWALDEAWKSQHEGPQGAHWGIWTETGVLKSGMDAVFTGVTVTGDWATDTIPGGPGTPEIRFTFVPPAGNQRNVRGRVLHVSPAAHRVLVYIRVRGRWWSKPFYSQPFTLPDSSGFWSTDITTGGLDAEASEVAAFLVPATVSAPLAAGASAIPRAVIDRAIASARQTR